LDGQRCLLECKGGSVEKIRNIPVIVLTNLKRQQIFDGEKIHASIRDAFFARVNYIRLEEGEEVWRIPLFSSGEPALDDDEGEDANPWDLAPSSSGTTEESQGQEASSPGTDLLSLIGPDGRIQFDSAAYMGSD